MDAPAPTEVFLFEAFRFDRRAGVLLRRDEGGILVPVTIGARALAVLDTLAAHRGDLVSKEEIMDAVWPGTAVAENNLTVQIAALRRVLDEGRAGGSAIQTIAGRGYRFVAPVRRTPAEVRADAAAVLPNAAPPRLSIVVLPFINLGNDPEQQYFADGITEDLTTDLSRLAGMLVISRNTAFTYRNKPIDTKQVGRELGVRYVLEGSVRQLGNQIRINAKLIDAETDAHLWAERFDRDLGDLFALQSEVTSRIAVALTLELVAAEAVRSNENPNALDYILRGRAAHHRPHTPEKYAEANGWFERALALDPQSVRARSFLAISLTSLVMENLTTSPTADLARAEELARQALAASPRASIAHFAVGQVLRVQGRFEEAVAEYETALAINPNSVFAYIHIAHCKIFIGSLDEAIPLVEQAMRLSPRDPEHALYYWRIGLVHLLQSRPTDAVSWLERALYAGGEKIGYIHLLLASAYALEGKAERAAAELAEARRLSAVDDLSSIARLRAAGFARSRSWGVPRVRALFEATYFAGLCKAGMPEK